jgi:hypothetical protein
MTEIIRSKLSSRHRLSESRASISEKGARLSVLIAMLTELEGELERPVSPQSSP